MRRRVDAKVMDTGCAGSHVGWGYPGVSRLVISEVPEDWRKHAREPWRLLFPDLEWVSRTRA